MQSLAPYMNSSFFILIQTFSPRFPPLKCDLYPFLVGVYILYQILSKSGFLVDELISLAYIDIGNFMQVFNKL